MVVQGGDSSCDLSAGRILASAPELPGVMAYGDIEVAAIRKVKSIPLQALAEMIERCEEIPDGA